MKPSGGRHCETTVGCKLSWEQGAFLDLDLLGEQQGTRLHVLADFVELYFVGDGWGEPCAADDADGAAVEGEFRDVLGKTDEIVYAWLTHEPPFSSTLLR
jgi:hypothetical protein